MVPSDPAYGGSDKQFCKGQIDEGETPLDAAKREGMEELGFIPENAISEYLELGKLNGIDFFAVEVNSKNLNPFHYETGSVHWIGMSEAFKIIREFQRPMLGTFFKVVRSKYSKNLY